MSKELIEELIEELRREGVDHRVCLRAADEIERLTADIERWKSLADANANLVEAQQNRQLREIALKAQSEPVAWMIQYGGECMGFVPEYVEGTVPVYTTPQPSQVITDKTAADYMSEILWHFIDTAAAFPKIKVDQRTWDTHMIYAPQPAQDKYAERLRSVMPHARAAIVRALHHCTAEAEEQLRQAIRDIDAAIAKQKES